MGDIYISRNEDGELMHYAKGEKKAGAKYTNRYMKNGKWVYEYGVNNAKRLESQARTHDRANDSDMATAQKYAHQLTTRKMPKGNRKSTAKKVRAYGMRAKGHREAAAAYRNQANKVYGKAYTQARNAARLVTSDKDYQKTLAKNARRSKVQGQIYKGKKKVSEILSRLRESVTTTRTEYNKKARAARTQATIRKTQKERAKKQDNIQKALNKGLQSKSKAYKRKRAAQARQEQFNNTVNTVKKTASKAKRSATKTVRRTKRKLQAAQKAYKNS